MKQIVALFSGIILVLLILQVPMLQVLFFVISVIRNTLQEDWILTLMLCLDRFSLQVSEAYSRLFLQLKLLMPKPH